MGDQINLNIIPFLLHNKRTILILSRELFSLYPNRHTPITTSPFITHHHPQLETRPTIKSPQTFSLENPKTILRNKISFSLTMQTHLHNSATTLSTTYPNHHFFIYERRKASTGWSYKEHESLHLQLVLLNGYSSILTDQTIVLYLIAILGLLAKPILFTVVIYAIGCVIVFKQDPGNAF